MKKMFAVFVLFLAMVAVGYCHPPSDIKINYDSKTKILKSVITHQVRDPKDHYIKEVIVKVNKKKVIVQDLNMQDNNKTQTVMYLLPNVNAGDIISVSGECSKFGKLEKQIKIAGTGK